jgi:type IV pilus assembly protein PilV
MFEAAAILFGWIMTIFLVREIYVIIVNHLKGNDMNKKGFSLLEVMIGMLILSIGLLGAASLGISSIQTNANANHLSEAANIAQAEFERLKTIPWSGLTNGNSVSISKTQVEFTKAWVVTTSDHVKDITLKVAWSPTHFLEFRTKIAR